jgi:transcription antitermination factor NusG
MHKSNKMWYVLYTKPRWEKKVHQLLIDKNYECYCPTQIIEKQWTDRVKKIEQPLFTSYVFIKTSSAQELAKVRFIIGVVNFVYWLGKPAVIKDEEILLLKEFLELNKKNNYSISTIKVNDRIKITSGVFKNSVGVVKKILKNKTILFIESLGIQITVTIKK